MPAMNDTSIYYSTRQTARILGISIGSVQRMVACGALRAYTTLGGHRRILASSVRHYCEARGVPGSALPSDADQVCIVHQTELAQATRQALAQMDHVMLVSHPLELTGMREDCIAFFIDARLDWLDWSGLQRPLNLASQARLIVYNSSSLPKALQAAIARHAQLHPGDLSADLISGFLLGLGSQSGSVVRHDTPSH